MHGTTEYWALGLYLAFLLVIGWVFARLNRNLSDFVRGGGQGLWWMVGTSSVMATISAFTFTGNASAAYEAGPTLLVIYAANCTGFLVGYLFLAAWFRQTRAYTLADIIKDRFGVAAEQFNVCSFAFLAPIAAAIQLWALAVFASAVFSLPLVPTIIVIGLVVTFYSTSGGRWGVMATDFLQSLVLIPITLVLAAYSLYHIGGVGGLLALFDDPAIAADYQFVKEAGQFSGDRFTLKWIVAIFLIQLSGFLSISGAPRYLSVKDGREGRKSALLALVLMTIGAVVWILPPLVVRATLAGEVAAMPLDNPAEGAYAVAALHFLPNGLLGIMVVAMFAATMSSMDTGLNMVTGTVARNFWPWLRGLAGWRTPAPLTELRVCRWVTVGLGLAIVILALMLAAQRSFQLFDAYFVIATLIGLPVTIPLVAGLFIKRLPFASYFVIVGLAVVPAAYSLWDGHFHGNPWTVQDRGLWVIGFGVLGVVLSLGLQRWESAASRTSIEALFQRMRCPIDPAEHEGDAKDHTQWVLMGRTSLAAGGFLLVLVVMPDDWPGRGAALFVAGFVLVTGWLLVRAARRHERAHALTSKQQ
jgi:solute:Na+ symporter, SSS family